MLNILELRKAFATVSVNLAVAKLAPCLGELGFSSSQVLYCLGTKNERLVPSVHNYTQLPNYQLGVAGILWTTIY